MLDSAPTVQDYKKILKLTLEKLKVYEAEFHKLRDSNAAWIKRWGGAIDILMPTMIEAAKQCLPDQPVWLLSFNEHLNKHKAEDAELKALDDQKWAYVMEHGFGITDIPDISLDLAREMTRSITTSFNEEIYKSLKAKHKPEEAMYQMLMSLEIPAFEANGFKGEQGYFIAQKGILEYFDDRLISEYGKEVHKKMLHKDESKQDAVTEL